MNIAASRIQNDTRANKVGFLAGLQKLAVHAYGCRYTVDAKAGTFTFHFSKRQTLDDLPLETYKELCDAGWESFGDVELPPCASLNSFGDVICTFGKL